MHKAMYVQREMQFPLVISEKKLLQMTEICDFPWLIKLLIGIRNICYTELTVFEHLAFEGISRKQSLLAMTL